MEHIPARFSLVFPFRGIRLAPDNLICLGHRSEERTFSKVGCCHQDVIAWCTTAKSCKSSTRADSVTAEVAGSSAAQMVKLAKVPQNQRASHLIPAHCRRCDDRFSRPFCPRPGFQKRLCQTSIRPTAGYSTHAQTSPNSSPNCAPKGLRNCLSCPLYSVDNTCAPRLMIPLLTDRL
jgi:hypothetical protein